MVTFFFNPKVKYGITINSSWSTLISARSFSEAILFLFCQRQNNLECSVYKCESRVEKRIDKWRKKDENSCVKNKLIEIYCTICQCNDSRFREELQRLSNNNCPQFTDEELITVYLWGKGQQLLTRKAIYNYTKTHLLDWFPKLPSYQAFCRRLNRIAGAFQVLADIWMKTLVSQNPGSCEFAVDSVPIMVACRSNSTRAKVGKPLCNKCYNATRKEWYHGVKVHVFSILRPGALPIPCAVQITKASYCDLWAAKQMMLELAPVSNGTLFADRAYIDSAWKEELREMYSLELTTPRKKRPDDVLKSGDCFSTYVSCRRQPIESLFNWMQTHSGIQSASHVRSLEGLLFHLFASLAFLFSLLLFYY